MPSREFGSWGETGGMMRVVDDRARYVEAVLVSDLLSGDGPHVEWADVWVGLDVVDAVGLAWAGWRRPASQGSTPRPLP